MGRPRKKFTTGEALELYEQGHSLKAIAEILSDRHGEKVSLGAVRDRFRLDGVVLSERKFAPLTGKERMRRLREKEKVESGESEGASRHRPMGRPVKVFDVGAAYEEYLKSGLEVAAKKYNISYSTLSERFKSFGLEVRKPGRPLEGDAPIPRNIRQQKHYRKKKC